MICDFCKYIAVVRIQRYFSDLTDLVAKSCGNEKCWLYMKDIVSLEHCPYYEYMSLYKEGEGEE